MSDIQPVVWLESAGAALSPYAADLDTLARERDAIFVVAAGNELPEHKYPRPSQLPDHPNYLLEDGRAVRQPAEALNVLTVGSISTDNDPHPADPAIRGAAGKRAPSPFTRAGALRNVVKPELVEEGGDLPIDRRLDRWAPPNPGLRIPTTGPEFVTAGKLFTYTDGTSIAASKVTHLAARVLGAMPDASANLVRALLVNSAGFPEGAQGYSKEHAMKLCGFGVPALDRALYCTDQRATLYYAGEIAIDAVLLFDIPVPAELTDSKGRKRITVTVAYDPLVSALEQVRPAGINLTWKVAKANVTDSVIETELVAAAEQELVSSEGESKGTKKTKKKVFEAGTLPRRVQQRGTVQKNIFEWHTDKQNGCNASEFTLDSGKRVDCIMASGETCLVIEFKPENSRAVSAGANQARGYATELNNELKNKDSSVIKKLINIKSDFEKCKQFTYRVDCYRLCPKIDENGDFQEAHPDWKRDCT